MNRQVSQVVEFVEQKQEYGSKRRCGGKMRKKTDLLSKQQGLWTTRASKYIAHSLCISCLGGDELIEILYWEERMFFSFSIQFSLISISGFLKETVKLQSFLNKLFTRLAVLLGSDQHSQTSRSQFSGVNCLFYIDLEERKLFLRAI